MKHFAVGRPYSALKFPASPGNLLDSAEIFRNFNHVIIRKASSTVSTSSFGLVTAIRQAFPARVPKYQKECFSSFLTQVPPDLYILLCVPTFNAGNYAAEFIHALRRQSVQPDCLVVMDSGSTDGSPEIFKKQGIDVRAIPQHEFNHGKTRQLCVDSHPEADFIVFLTQDAILRGDDSLQALLACFGNEQVGAAYGRQLPRMGAGAIEVHARLFNYPESSALKSLADVPRLGFKAAFLSNSFAAYRRSALVQAGGFPSQVILGEDTWVAARMLTAGWKIAYCADATVEHSHDFSFIQEFRRYFDIGVFHGRESWIPREFGKPTGEGLRYIRSEWRFLAKMAPSLFLSAFTRTVLKFIGYKLGTVERLLPLWLKRHLSLHVGFWTPR